MSKLLLVDKLDRIEQKITDAAEHLIEEVKDEAHELLSKVEALLTPPETVAKVAPADGIEKSPAETDTVASSGDPSSAGQKAS